MIHLGDFVLGLVFVGVFAAAIVMEFKSDTDG